MFNSDWLSISPRRLLLLAAVVHITLAVVITLVGKSKVVPHTFDTNGIGISFALDSVSYRDQAVQMASLLRAARFRDWMNYDAPLATFHARLYSISYALLGTILGEGILAVEPLNLFYYLSMLTLTYLIGAAVFTPSVGRLAALIVGLWPSLLIYSTQLVRDPLFICTYLLLLFSLIVCIKQAISSRQTIAYTVSGVAALSLILLARSTMWELVVATVLLAALLFMVRQITTRKFEMRNIIATLLMCAATFVLPKIMNGRGATDRAQRAISKSSASANNLPPWTKMSRQVGWMRHRFISAYTTAGSNLDTEVELQSFRDVVMYLPRATQIGLLAPFPRLWFSKGVEVGRTGRLIVGAEMLGIYLLLTLVCVTLVYERKRLMVWFLFAVGVLGCVALAYIVINVGALYRLRYPYFIPIILLGAQGFYILRNNRRVLNYRTGAKRRDSSYVEHSTTTVGGIWEVDGAFGLSRYVG